jgi:hypothetical protein
MFHVEFGALSAQFRFDAGREFADVVGCITSDEVLAFVVELRGAGAQPLQHLLDVFDAR